MIAHTPIRYRRTRTSPFIRKLKAALLLRGYNLTSWSEAHGFLPRTVHACVHRYAGTQDAPQGRLTWKILCELSREVGMELSPGSLSEVA